MKRTKKLSARDLVILLHTKAEQLQYPVVKIGRSILLRETGRRNLSAAYIGAATKELRRSGYACAWRTRPNGILGQCNAGYAVTALYYSKHNEYVQSAVILDDWEDDIVTTTHEQGKQKHLTQEYINGLTSHVFALEIDKRITARNPALNNCCTCTSHEHTDCPTTTTTTTVSGFTKGMSIVEHTPVIDLTARLRQVFENSRYGAKGEHYGDQESISV